MSSLVSRMPINLSVSLESSNPEYFLFLLRTVSPAPFCINAGDSEAVTV